MFEIDQTDPDFVVISPKGSLSKEDFDTLAATIDAQINERDAVPNFLFCIDKIPHWDGLDALSRHLQFIRSHEALVKKIALVGDSRLLSLGPDIADHFVKAKLRHFPMAKLEEAKVWLRSDRDDPGRFELIDGLPSDVIALRAVGIITPDDYHEVLDPLVEEKLKQHDKLKCLVVLDDAFTAYPLDAMWEDTKFGVHHMRDFTRIALVTDLGWLVKGTRLLAPLLPYTIKVFGTDHLEEAKSWIKR